MKAQAPNIIQTLTNAPLPMMLEKLGMSIANAQAALDANSIKLANEMATVEIDVAGKPHNLISLGFAPTFYAFTEATIEIKMEFSISESEDYGIKGAYSTTKGKSESKDTKDSKSTSFGVSGLSFSGHYARKFEMSAEASSSIAARIVSLPTPDTYLEILKSTIK